MATRPQSKYAAPAAAAAADVLLALARSGSALTTSELALQTGRTKSLVYRVLAELEARRLVMRTESDRAFSLGVAAVELGGAYTAAVPRLSSIRHVLRGLADLTNETANFGILQGDQVLYLLREEGEGAVVSVSRVGKLLPANATALGKSLLAELPDDEVREVFAARLEHGGKLTELTPRTLTSMDDLLWELQRTRARGYAEDDGETVLGRHCAGVAVPFGEGGASLGAIGVSVSEHRFRVVRDEVIAELLDAKERVSREHRARASIE